MSRFAAMLSLVVGLAACSEGPSAVQPTSPGAPPFVTRTELEGPPRLESVTEGEVVQLRVFAVLSDGTRQDVTTNARFSVVDERVVRVGPSGAATAVGLGATGVFASYRNLSSVVGYGIRVVRSTSEAVYLTARVLDQDGVPIVGARVVAIGEGELRPGVTDDNGFADLGTGAGRVTITASRLGYADATAAVSGVAGPVQVAMRLTSNPGPFIERRIEDVFDTFEDGFAVRRYRIVTRAGGIFDAEVDSQNCDDGGTLTITARSGETDITSTGRECYGRVRFIVPRDDIQLTLRGHKATTFRLTYREPR